MLNVVANALRSPHNKVIENCCGPYQNEPGEWGYYITVWDAGHYHMISVSHVAEPPSLREVAAAITSPLAELVQADRYYNRRNTLGWWGTVKSGEHWYMISVSDLLQPYHGQWWADRNAI